MACFAGFAQCLRRFGYLFLGNALGVSICGELQQGNSRILSLLGNGGELFPVLPNVGFGARREFYVPRLPCRNSVGIRRVFIAMLYVLTAMRVS